MNKGILYTLYSTLLLLVISLCPQQMMATHIVGGEMNYRCLGNNEYEISLTVFRDCDTGIPWFDNPASIGIFNGITNALMFSTSVSPTNNDTLPIYLPDSCLIVPSNVCIHTTTYYDTLSLPFSLDGYTIVYQRCCRNRDIVNIIDPDAAGASYWINISPAALQLCNTSPVFKEWPRVYLCSGVPIAFDHSATDLDGDSIVYELCTPWDGDFVLSGPVPQPPNNPPYPLINWQNPYNTADMFGNPADPLAIDPVTGLLTGTPINLGVFLVGVCMKEYRNGNLISETRRDFQHVIGTCQPQTIASFDTTSLICNKALQFPFANTSQVVTGTYNWTFDTLGTTTLISPTYTFPDTGTYTVTLVAGLGSPCLDTFSVDMNLEIQGIELVIIPPQVACQGDSVWIVVTDLYEGYSDSSVYNWAPDSVIITGQGTDSILVIADHNVAFSVMGINSFGCISTAGTSINVPQITAQFDTVTAVCNTALLVQFINSSMSNPVNNNFQWNFDAAGTSSLMNPSFIFPDTGNYTITLVTGGNTICSDTFEMDIDLSITAMQLSPIASQVVCAGDSVWISANDIYQGYSSSATYTWTPNGPITSGQGTDSILIIANSAVQMQVSGVNSYGCSSATIFNIDVVSVEADFDTIDLACNTSLVMPFVNSSTSNLISNNYLWTFDALATSTVVNPIYTFPDTGSYIVSLVAGIGSLCPDTMIWDLYLPLYGVDLLNIAAQDACIGDSIWLKATDLLEFYSSSIQYTWAPASSILAGQGTDSVLLVVGTTTSIQVAAINSHLCQDSTLAAIDIVQATANFDTVTLVCNTSLVVPFLNRSTSNPVNNNYEWIFDNLGTSTDFNPVYTFPDTGTYTVQLVAGVGGLCPDTTNMDVYLPLLGLDLTANDVQVICKEDTVLLLVTNSLDAYTDSVDYQWSPSSQIISGQGNDSAYALMDTTTTFVVIGVNSHGCIDTAEAGGTIIYISPSLSITATPDSVFVGQISQLLATDDVDYIYNWLPDTTLSAYDINNPEVSPRITTTYYLAVDNQFGCRTNDSVVVNIKEPICGLPIIFVPNAFTPDGDGHNDVLMVNGNNIDQMTMAIYNRWGQKVFETNDQSIGWDGTFKGQLLAPDVYGYYMKCTCDDGSDLFIKGNITLLR